MNTQNASCIKDGCGKQFDKSIPETRDSRTLRPFWQRYCPEHRVTGKTYEPIVEIPAKPAKKLSKIYVGIRSEKSSTGTPGTRVVFRNVLEPTPETHPQYSAVIGPFRTVRGANFMAQFGASNPHCQTVADAERIAKDYVPSVSEQTVYVASAWWSDCDAFVTVCGNSSKHVEKAVMRAMRDAAIDAYNQSEPEDKRRVRDYLDEISWSGVNTFQFDAIISEHTIDRYEPGFSGGEQTVVHDSDMDYFDYEALRRGDKDAIVYLPTA